MSDGLEVAVRLPTRLWQIIDGTLDNAVSTAVQTGDSADLPRAGRRIREAGWHQITGWTRDHPGSSRGWPPDDELVTVTLPRAAWELILAQLDHGNAISADLGDEEGVQLGHAARQVVHEQLP